MQEDQFLIIVSWFAYVCAAIYYDKNSILVYINFGLGILLSLTAAILNVIKCFH